VPMEFPVGLGLSAICEREDYRDAFVSNKFNSFSELPENAVVGSSSLRRQCQLRAARPDIQLKDLRGNINTRLNKLDAGDYDAIILATAGLLRLGFQDRIREMLDIELCLPAGGQGAVGIESRLKDTEITTLIETLNHAESAICVGAERAMNERLNGGCQVPIASLARLDGETLHLQGIVGSPDGAQILAANMSGKMQSYMELGNMVAEKLLEQGAQRLLNNIA
jgi:hydroxymethylbilane synthase